MTSYIVYYPIGGRQGALNILLLLAQGVQPASIDLPRGFKIEKLAPMPLVEVEDINPIWEQYDLGGEG